MRRFLFGLLLFLAPTLCEAQGALPMCSPPGSNYPVICSEPGLGNAGYPVGAIPLANSGVGTTGGASATLAAAVGKFTYFCGYSVSPGSATAAITITITIAGLQGGSHVISVGAPITAAGTTAAPIFFFLPFCIPASAVNTAITVTAGALGTGGVNQAVNVWGYQQ